MSEASDEAIEQDAQEVVSWASVTLDRVRPGWVDLIDLYTLDMGSCEDCILGQVFGTYTDGLAALDADLNADVAHAFDDGPAILEAWYDAIDARVR